MKNILGLITPIRNTYPHGFEVRCEQCGRYKYLGAFLDSVHAANFLRRHLWMEKVKGWICRECNLAVKRSTPARSASVDHPEGNIPQKDYNIK